MSQLIGTPGPSPAVSAGQRSQAAPLVINKVGVNADKAMLVWTGTSDANYVNFALGDPTTLNFAGQAKYSTNFPSPWGPDAVLKPSGTAVTLLWSSSSNVNYVDVVQNADGTWSFASTSVASTIPGASPAGGPSGDICLIGGKPYIIVAWADAVQNSMCGSAIPLFGGAASAPTKQPQPCKGTPEIKCFGKVNMLAWTGTDQSVNFAVDPAGGLNFNFENVSTLVGAKSNFGPNIAVMPDLQTGYIAWMDTVNGLCLNAMTVDYKGNWTFTGNPIQVGVTSMSGGPSLQTITITDSTGLQVTALQFTYADSTANIQTMTYKLY